MPVVAAISTAAAGAVDLQTVTVVVVVVCKLAITGVA